MSSSVYRFDHMLERIVIWVQSIRNDPYTWNTYVRSQKKNLNLWKYKRCFPSMLHSCPPALSAQRHILSLFLSCSWIKQNKQGHGKQATGYKCGSIPKWGLFENSGMLSVAMTTTMMMVMAMRTTTATKALCGECGSWLCCYFCCDTVRPTVRLSACGVVSCP